jgi:hypothetical protein
VKIDFFVLDRSPETFDENIVAPVALAVHAQLRRDLIEHVDEGVARELRAVIGVEYLGATVFGQRSFKCRNAEIGREANRDGSRENLARCPIKNREEINKTAAHRNICDARCPHVIGPIDDRRCEEDRERLGDPDASCSYCACGITPRSPSGA